MKFACQEDMVAYYVNCKTTEMRDAIVAHHAPMVERIARKFAGASEPVEDLAQEGFIGLLNALEMYDPAKGVKFTTYATHLVVGQIKHHLRDRGKIIKEPAWLQELNQKIVKCVLELTQTLGRQPSPAEIGAELDMPEENIIEVITSREVFKVSSIDATTDEDDGEKSFDIDKIEAIEQTNFHLPTEDRVVLETAMNQLKDIEQKVLKLFFYESLSQTDVANRLNISCNYVSHILRNSVQKLRKILTTEELKDKQLQNRSGGSSTHIIDDQTGVYSQNYFKMRLEEELQRSSCYNIPVSLVLIKLNGLEQFRAFYGDMTVSEFLAEAAVKIKLSIRKSDVLSRSGDWEFAVILPHTGSSVHVAQERLENTLNDWCTSLFGKGSSFVQVEVNSAVFPRDAVNALRLMDLVRNQFNPPLQIAA